MLLVPEAATYTTHNKLKRRTSIPSAGFEPASPAIRRLQNYALDRTTTGIGDPYIIRVIQSRRMKSVGHVALMGERRNVYRGLDGNLEGERPLVTPTRRWEIIK